MSKYLFKYAKFITTATQWKEFPILCDATGDALPEIAVVGRSNVGKSSLLNDLFLSKGLVKTSSLPGKTQAVNFFTLNNQLAFVDLPGYGYAKVPMSTRKHWGPMVKSYLEKREPLKVILYLFDIRRIPNEDDINLLNWMLQYNKEIILVLTKADKINQSDRIANPKKILEAFNFPNGHYILYSTLKNMGRKELVNALLVALNDKKDFSEENSQPIE